MQLREVDQAQREIVGLVAPYDETSYMTNVPGGERLRRGCFAKSIQERGDRIPLCIGHNHRTAAVGKSTSWQDSADGLVATFKVRAGEDGDKVLADAHDGYLPALSVGFEAKHGVRGLDGAVEVTEAKLHEVSLVVVGAYAGAQVMAVRSADQVRADLDALLVPFRNPPQVDMSPLPPLWR
jgi:HK97 family phage prohead protease